MHNRLESSRKQVVFHFVNAPPVGNLKLGRRRVVFSTNCRGYTAGHAGDAERQHGITELR